MNLWKNLKGNRITIGNTSYGNVSGKVTNRLVTAVPLLFVNGIAVTGQYGWASDHLKSWHTIGQIAFAFGLESVAIFLAYNAYLCEKRNDSALRLKLASYSFALVVAGINYSHFTSQWNKPTTVGIVVGIMSAISPWLWSTYSRSVSRAILFTRGLIDEHALRLGATRWLWHPVNSFHVMRMATWTGSKKPSDAITQWEENERDKKRETKITQSMNGTKSYVKAVVNND